VTFQLQSVNFFHLNKFMETLKFSEKDNNIAVKTILFSQHAVVIIEIPRPRTKKKKIRDFCCLMLLSVLCCYLLACVALNLNSGKSLVAVKELKNVINFVIIGFNLILFLYTCCCIHFMTTLSEN